VVGPNKPPEFSGPVAVVVTADGEEIPGIAPTDPNGAVRQARRTSPQEPIKLPNGSNLTLAFTARADQKGPFIGLDNVSLRQLHPVSVCLGP